MTRLVLVDSVAAAWHLQRAYQLDIQPGTIRVWAHRGYIQVHKDGRYRYNLLEIVEYARERGLIGG